MTITGPLFGFSDTWQLVINTGTTIVTFLMVFLIQNTQNRDSAAVQLKLDELIRAVNGAHNALLDLEELTDRDLDRLRSRYEALARSAFREAIGSFDNAVRLARRLGSEPRWQRREMAILLRQGQALIACQGYAAAATRQAQRQARLSTAITPTSTSSCWARCVPTSTISTRPAVSDPAMAPSVLAA